MSRPVPAATWTHGPFRRVVSVGEREHTHPDGSHQTVRFEILECGHQGAMLVSVARVREQATKRRCLQCLSGWQAEQDAKQAVLDAEQASRNADDAARVRAELTTPAGRAAHDEALRRRRTFTAVGNVREEGTR